MENGILVNTQENLIKNFFAAQDIGSYLFQKLGFRTEQARKRMTFF